MSRKLRGLFRIIFGRTTFVMVGIGLQLAFFVLCAQLVKDYIHALYLFSILLSAVAIIYIMNAPISSSFKLAWVIPILVIPFFGVWLYIFVQTQPQTRRMAQRIGRITEDTKRYLRQDEDVVRRLREDSGEECRLADYMNHFAGYPVYENTRAEFYPQGEDKFEALLRELRAAKRFIFLEYFIIDRGYMWDSVLEILKQKVKEGVEVRVMYDGMCCLMLLPFRYPQELERLGIRCKMFSPIRPVLSTHQNNRDHRKIVVIDGQTAFTGGVNLADEYIGRRIRFGHWKDTAVMIKGDAVKSATVMFLQMWNVVAREPEHYEDYLPEPLGRLPVQTGQRREIPRTERAGGFVIPFGDSPMDHERVGEQVYMDILNQAKEYVHIMTPYLILDDEMRNALCFAAKRGVDVKIIMPHIPDKRYAYLLARTYYPELIAAGVKIYSYTPGFVHAKIFVSDNEKAVVGTINLDFRSLYLHFECGIYFYRNPVIADVERDYQETLEKCRLVTLEDCRRYNRAAMFAGSLLRLVAPLM